MRCLFAHTLATSRPFDKDWRCTRFTVRAAPGSGQTWPYRRSTSSGLIRQSDNGQVCMTAETQPTHPNRSYMQPAGPTARNTNVRTDIMQPAGCSGAGASQWEPVEASVETTRHNKDNCDAKVTSHWLVIFGVTTPEIWALRPSGQPAWTRTRNHWKHSHWDSDKDKH